MWGWDMGATLRWTPCVVWHGRAKRKNLAWVARSAKIWVGSREARCRVMVCAGAGEARLHEDVLEMKVLLAHRNPKIFLKARLARALRAYLAPTIS